ncbi:Kinesin-like protein KIF20A [Pitangus sulphuratus]|nr:Kinesin-like protein KIF20A [Pitangus sulphuratus]
MDDEGKNYVPAEVSDVLESVSFLNVEGKPSPLESTVLPNMEEQQVYHPLKVFLRVRPFSIAELESHESQGCVTIEDAQTVILNAPKESSAMKNSERGIGHAVHRFTFSQVFGPETTQSEFFDSSMKEIVRAYVNGVNGLVFTYGVTNAGKTFTIQGTSKDLGILPRSLDVIFNHIRERHYLKMNFKPYLSNDVKKLEDAQVKQEEALKTAILASLKEIYINLQHGYLLNLGIRELAVFGAQDLKWINVQSTEEACKILKIGNKNRSFACTRMNEQSSRRLSFCDLAGSERCNKTHVFGDRLKEAGNINNSLHILGKCIAALKQNQNPNNRLEDMKDSYEEKLESKFEMYKEAIKKHAYMCAMEQIEDHYVPIEEFLAEQEKVENHSEFLNITLSSQNNWQLFSLAVLVCSANHKDTDVFCLTVPDRERKILQLERQLDEQSGKLLALGSPNSDVVTTENNMERDLMDRTMKRANEGLQKQCEEKEELIKSLKFKIQKLNETLLEANEGYRKMAEENSQLKHTIMLKDQEINSLQNWATCVLELEETVSSLQKELGERKKHFFVEKPKQQKPRRGLLANLKSPAATTACTPLAKGWGKNEEASPYSRKKVLLPHKAKD